MITFTKLFMHFLMLATNYVVMLSFALLYCKKKNFFMVLQSVIVTVSLISFLKTINFNFSEVNSDLFTWRFPCYELIMAIVFFGMLLDVRKYKYVTIYIAVLALLMVLHGYQNINSLLFNLLFGILLVFFLNSIEKTFTDFQSYLVLVCFSVCTIPFKLGYFTSYGIMLFWLLVLTYPMTVLVRYFSLNYCSSLLSRIS